MLAQLGKHARFDLRVDAKGDLEVDAHHTVEDTGIAIGQALAEALGDKSGVRRFGDAVVPLDEARARAAVDLSGRPYLVWDVEVDAAPGELGSFDPRQARHLMEALVANARCTIHVQLEAGDLPHHCLEACFKALARALGDACAPDPRAGAGTKGSWMTRPPVAVLDYGVGNLHSAAKALDRAGAEVRVVPTVAEAGGAAGLVVPGVGAYGACLNGLASAGGAAAVAGWLEGAGPCSASASACSCCSRPARKARSATASGSSPARSGASPAT